jgi:hypothetical protein
VPVVNGSAVSPQRAPLRLGSCSPSGSMDETQSSSGEDASGEAVVRERLRVLIRRKPWLAVATAAAAGGLLGGICFSRAARLVFAGATGFVAHDLWQREGRLGVSDIVRKVASGRGAGRSTDADERTAAR